ncbi:patatin-like phospholipase family protein [Rhodoferax mekongensis]|uniref:patatin-like phospholipase family protein n=1 Tax=Rhodoferax mekongensis TaxID=3068341 RepID=UPI0028BD654A|nr:patatin-like phospholipase family protein [Rhodoferax sp. TBRC 17199]MDT7516814.1 patatin-like phospholipase family protein [Rhodoferax sp. TBRC 17199]
MALAGGGPLGAIYEVGALCALHDSLAGLDFNHLDHYVGVSAGGFIAAALANGLTPHQLCASFIEGDADSNDFFDPAWLMQPAYDEWARRGIMLPGLLASVGWGMLTRRTTAIRALERLAPALPTGVFSNSQVDTQLSRLFNQDGRTNDFRKLACKLTLVATHLDSAEAVAFGSKGWDHISISKAVQASSALPGLFPPVAIDDQYFVDGAMKKTMHASVALDEGADLLICLNPLVPFDATAPQYKRIMQAGIPAEKRNIPRIVDGGLPAVLSQTFRSMIHSRMELGMKHYAHAYPDTDIVLIEPDHRDPELYLANTFSYAQRRQLAEHAYQQTRQLLRSRKTGLSAQLHRHGIQLRHDVLDDPKRHLCAPRKSPSRLGQALGTLQDVMEDLSHVVRHETLLRH